MYEVEGLRKKVASIINDEKIEYKIEILDEYALAVLAIEELSCVAKSEGLFAVEERVAKLKTISNIDVLVQLINGIVEGVGFDDVVDQMMDSLPRDFSAITYYVYILGTLNLQNFDANEIIEDISNLLSIRENGVLQYIYKLEKEKANAEKRTLYVNKFYNSEVCSDDKVFESYFKATSEDFRSLTDEDILLIYNKIPEKILVFLQFADSDVKAKLTRIINDHKVQEYVMEFGEFYCRAANKCGMVKFSGYTNQYNLVMDVHEVIFDEYSAGHLKGGSEKILKPDIVEPSMEDRLRSMGIV